MNSMVFSMSTRSLNPIIAIPIRWSPELPRRRRWPLLWRGRTAPCLRAPPSFRFASSWLPPPRCPVRLLPNRPGQPARAPLCPAWSWRWSGYLPRRGARTCGTSGADRGLRSQSGSRRSKPPRRLGLLYVGIVTAAIHQHRVNTGLRSFHVRAALSRVSHLETARGGGRQDNDAVFGAVDSEQELHRSRSLLPASSHADGLAPPDCGGPAPLRDIVWSAAARAATAARSAGGWGGRWRSKNSSMKPV